MGHRSLGSGTIAFLVAAAALAPLSAAEVETQHAFDFTTPIKPNVELTLHSRIRTQPGSRGFYQYRVGPILTWSFRPRISLIGGYYYARQEQLGDRDFIGGHRFFVGGELSVLQKPRFLLDQRLLAERFVTDVTSRFNRYRFRTRISSRRPVAPYASYEFFLDAKGWRSTRYSGGIRWRLLPVMGIDLGYFYEQRRGNVGPDRHMWLTAVNFTRSSSRSDPDR